ncbi:hypothetical protein QE152_g14006 [Popillia japonica]|uniref:DUF4817 domain-containing protein n=1 Tax=Popillia japonica TaxID=7064 RepID=A0AAW1LAC2_POPJA
MMSIIFERYPNRNLPHHQRFVKVFQRFRKTGNIKLKEARERANIRPVQLHEAILGRGAEDPAISTRRISAVENTRKSTVLKEQSLHTFHYQQVQALTEGDSEN